MQALAELGFVVVCIDGMGTPFRSKAFHEAYYGDMGDNTIPDQVAGMKELAAQYPWIDLDRVGIYGHSGGGNATGGGHAPLSRLLQGRHRRERQPRQARLRRRLGGKVGRAAEVKNPDGTQQLRFARPTRTSRKNLKGHLLLVHGTMDDNVPPNNTLLVVDALIKANKDFDLIMIPNAHHGYGAASQYMMRRRWDYFVRYLAGDIPPNEYQMKPFSQMST